MKLRRDISVQQLAMILFERSGLKSELARMTYGSPLREWRLGVVAAYLLSWAFLSKKAYIKK